MNSKAMDFNPIACETCRSKKCKCDRKLPSCSQCQMSSLACRYQEGGKRGLPAAYMTSLETRLHDTERTLYAAVRALHANDGIASVLAFLDADIPTYPITPRSKVDKQSEWKRRPLQTSKDLVVWFEEQHQRIEDSLDTEVQVEPPRGDPIVEQYGAETPTTSTTSKVQDERLAQHAHPLSVSSEAVMSQLRHSRPPLVPNGSSNVTNPAAWYDNYF
ncbi:hypothetical protein CC86DRAFT_162669 [Ophiobolus disseminans]|uniref:Zn(2)-C6 fungal-type domain-containing protein n=1 Tax=Ophiobolus disseminans TaxID=1469910 RepID=A0A6A7AD68_9PLEO|nr:hypothetical protein CC86DRAFT_162669 [Ophiobolus disseminans]